MDGRTASLHAYDRQESVWRRKDGKKGTSTNTAQAASTSTHTTLYTGPGRACCILLPS